MTARHLLTLALLTPLSACMGAPRQPEPNPPALSQQTTCPETRNWTAHINAMPQIGQRPGAQGPTLIVSGEARVPDGMELSLVPGPLDRMMPPAQRFMLRIAPGNSGTGQGPIGWQGVRAEIRPAQSIYRAVIIGCEDNEVARIEDIQTAY